MLLHVYQKLFIFGQLTRLYTWVGTHIDPTIIYKDSDKALQDEGTL